MRTKLFSTKCGRSIFTDTKESSRRQGNNGWLHASTRKFTCLFLIPEPKGFLFTILLLAASGGFCLSVLVSFRAEEDARTKCVTLSARISTQEIMGAIFLVRIDSLEDYTSKRALLATSCDNVPRHVCLAGEARCRVRDSTHYRSDTLQKQNIL